MNKHIVNALSKYNFTYENNYGYGDIEGYEVNVFNNSLSVGPNFVISTFLSEEQKRTFVLRFKDCKFPLCNAQYFDLGVVVTIGAITARTFEKKFDKVMPKVLSILSELGATKKDRCPVTGEEINELNSSLVPMPNTYFKIRISNDGHIKENEKITKENDDFKKAPNNYLKGFIGILLGAIVGAAITLVAGYFGYITAYAPVVAIFLGIFLYKKFGGKPNYVMVAMSFVTVLVLIMGAWLSANVLLATKVLADAGYDYKGFEALGFFLVNSEEYASAFYLDLTLNVLFILMAEALSFISVRKMIKRPTNI
jgi:hypothetical protein